MIQQVAEQVAVLEKEVISLNKENELQNRIFSKFEETIEKLQLLTETMNRLIIQHEERIRVNSDSVEALREEMRDEIKDLETRLSQETNNLCQKIERSEERILAKLAELKKEWNAEQERQKNADEAAEKKYNKNTGGFTLQLNTLADKFNKWRWFIAGGIFVFGWMTGKNLGFFSGMIAGLFK